MKNIKTLMVSYLIALAVGVFISLFVVIPLSLLTLKYENLFLMIFSSFIMDAFIPAGLSLFLFLPICSYRKMENLPLLALGKKYLPLVMLPLGILFLVMMGGGVMYGIGPYVFAYAYLISMISLYAFCKTLISHSR